MLNFIILGVIPGTQEQLNFYGLLLIVSVVCGLLGVVLSIRRRHIVRRVERTTFRLISM